MQSVFSVAARRRDRRHLIEAGVVHARLPEMCQWLIVPTQENPQAQITWQALKLSDADALADRASKKLKPDFLVSSLAPTILRMELDRVPLWRGGNHVAIRQLVEDFGRYLYLPRLRDGAVLLNAIRSELSLLTREKDSYAYADSFDEEAGRYRVCIRATPFFHWHLNCVEVVS
jgi:hypothetical protein